MPDDADIRQSIPDLERELVEVQIRVEEIALVLPPLLEREVLAVRLGEEELLPRGGRRRHALFLAHLLAAARCALGVHHRLAFFHLFCAGFPRLGLLANAQHVDTREQSTVQVGLVAVHVAVQPGVDPPLDDAEGLVEQRGQPVADGVLEVVAEDEFVACDVLLGHEGEGDGVAVVGVLGGGEVGGGGGGAGGEAWGARVSVR